MPRFCCLQHFQTCTKSQETAVGVISSKPMAMQQRGGFETLLSSLELFRVTPVTPGAFTFTKWWGKAAVGCDTALIAGSSDCVMRLSSSCSSSSREPWKSQGKTFHSASVIMLLKCHGFGHRGAMMRGACCLGFFLPAPQFLHIQFFQITQSKGIYSMKAKGLCLGSWTQYFLYSFGIIWMLNVFSWRVEVIAVVLNENGQCQHTVTQWITSRIEMTSLSIIEQEGLWDSNLMC